MTKKTIAISVRCNGRVYQLPPGSSVNELLERVGRPAQPHALALNARVVPASLQAETRLQEGDVVELVVAAQGG